MTRGLLLLALVAAALTGALTQGASGQDYALPPPPSPPAPPPVIQPLGLMSPSPVVRIVGRLTIRGAQIRLLSVRAPANATIFVRCFRRGCRARSRTVGRGSRRAVRFRRFERNLRAGTIIEVHVGRRDVIGKFTRFRIRRGRAPARRDLCLLPGESRGSACPEL